MNSNHREWAYARDELVDEMLAICSEIEAWRNKKASEEANAAYNEYLQGERPE